MTPHAEKQAGGQTPILLPHHQKFLHDRAVADEMAAGRGYRSATTRSELERLGFGRTQRLSPAIVIPVWSVTGQIGSYQLRPDRPRMDAKGKARKYEMKSGSRMLLDVHPRLNRPHAQGKASMIVDPAVPLFITEGIPKADAAISLGLCCIALLGVWNWRGSNEAGGRTALADWEAIALNGRKVYVAFDSDVMENPKVHAALARLKEFLESRGATIKLIYLLAGEHGEKVGLDDYIASEKAASRSDAEVRDSLLALAADEVRPTKGTISRERPAITLIPGNFPAIVDKAEKVLVANSERLRIFQRAGEIMRIISLTPEEAERAKRRDGLERPEGAAVLHPLTNIALLEIFDRLIAWEGNDATGEPRPKDCPGKVAAYYSSRVGSWLLPYLTGIIEAPCLRPDGSVLSQVGYDAETGLYLCADGWLAIPDKPTQAQAKDALRVLMGPFAQFPCVTEADRSVLLSGILTALQRRQLASAPLHGFSAPAQRSGKSLLAESIGVVATGRKPAAMGVANDDGEIRKAITSTLREGHLIVNLDNLTHPLGSRDLARAITQAEYADRLLGANQLLRLPTNVLWLATGNNLALKGDMPSRAIVSRIDAGVERPEERTFTIPDLPAHLLANRKCLVAAALTILRAFHVSGSPKQNVKPWGGFDQWSREIREPLVWLGMADPCQTRDRIVVNDPDRELAAGVLIAWNETFADSAMLVREVIEAAREGTDLHRALLAVAACRDDSSAIDPRRLGSCLAGIEDRVIDGLRLTRTQKVRRAVAWKVSCVSSVSPNPADPNNGADSDTGPAHQGENSERPGSDSPNSPDSPSSGLEV